MPPVSDRDYRILESPEVGFLRRRIDERARPAIQAASTAAANAGTRAPPFHAATAITASPAASSVNSPAIGGGRLTGPR
jgi:hypothetical protein